MNVYLFELKSLLKSTLVWTAAIAAILLLLMKVFYPAMIAAKAQMEAILSSYSPEVLKALGLDLDKIFSYEGFYVFSYTYIGLLAAIMAVSLTLQAMAREKRAKCADFILTKPMTRNGIFTAKFLACCSVVVLFNIIYVLLVAVDFLAQNGAANFPSHFYLLLLAPGLTQLVFVALSALYAVCAKKVRSISGTATAFGFAALLLSSLVEMLEMDWLNYIAPLQYFNPSFIFNTGSFAPRLTVMAIAVFICCLILAVLRNRRQDITAV